MAPCWNAACDRSCSAAVAAAALGAGVQRVEPSWLRQRRRRWGNVRPTCCDAMKTEAIGRRRITREKSAGRSVVGCLGGGGRVSYRRRERGDVSYETVRAHVEGVVKRESTAESQGPGSTAAEGVRRRCGGAARRKATGGERLVQADCVWCYQARRCSPNIHGNAAIERDEDGLVTSGVDGGSKLAEGQHSQRRKGRRGGKRADDMDNCLCYESKVGGNGVCACACVLSLCRTIESVVSLRSPGCRSKRVAVTERETTTRCEACTSGERCGLRRCVQSREGCYRRWR